MLALYYKSWPRHDDWTDGNQRFLAWRVSRPNNRLRRADPNRHHYLCHKAIPLKLYHCSLVGGVWAGAFLEIEAAQGSRRATGPPCAFTPPHSLGRVFIYCQCWLRMINAEYRMKTTIIRDASIQNSLPHLPSPRPRAWVCMQCTPQSACNALHSLHAMPPQSACNALHSLHAMPPQSACNALHSLHAMPPQSPFFSRVLALMFWYIV